MYDPLARSLYLGTVMTGSGIDIRSHEGQVLLAQKVLSLPISQPVPSARHEQSVKTNAAD